MIRQGLLLLLLTAAILGGGCAERITGSGPQSVSIAVPAKPHIPGSPIEPATYLLTVTAADMRPLSAQLILEDGVIRGEITVPVGPGRRFVLEAIAGDGAVVYRGTTEADISPGDRRQLDIDLSPVVPLLALNPHFTDLIMGESLAFRLNAFNLPDMGQMNIVLAVADAERLLVFDSAALGSSPPSGTRLAATADNMGNVSLQIGPGEIIASLTDELGDGHLVTVYFTTFNETPAAEAVADCQPSVIALTTPTGETVDAAGVYTDIARVHLSKDIPTGDDTLSTVSWRVVTGDGGDDWAYSLCPVSDGGVIAVGQSYNTAGSNWDGCIVGIDAYGRVRNRRLIGGSGVDGLTGLTTAPSGDIVACGWASRGAGEDILLTRLDDYGLPLLTRYAGTTGDDRAGAITATADGGYISASSYRVAGSLTSYVLVSWITADLDVPWNQYYSFDDYNEATAALGLDDGHAVIAGVTGSLADNSFDIFIMEVDDGGEVIWQRRHGGNGLDWCTGIAAAGDGGYMLSGYTYSHGAGSGDAWLVKLDAAGAVVWEKTYGGPAHDRANAIAATADGGFVLAGSSASFETSGADIYLLKVDATGGLLWQRTYGEAGSDEAHDCRIAADGGILVAGAIESTPGDDFDIIVLKTDADGLMPATP